MMKRLTKFLLLFPGLAMIFAGCSKNSDSIAVTSVSLDAQSVALKVGEQQKINATIKPDNATNKTFYWTSNEPNICQVLGGLVTAYAPGETDVICHTKDGDKTASCHVTVSEKDPHIEKVNGVILDRSELTIQTGKSATLTATVQPLTAANKNVTWNSTNTGVATVQDGVISALVEGTTVITVTTEDGGFTASCAITVTDDDPTIHVTGVSLPASANVYFGKSLQLKADVAPKSATDKSVSWSSGDSTIVEVDQNGVLTGIKESDTPVAVKVTTTDGGFEATCQVSVLPTLPDYCMILVRNNVTTYLEMKLNDDPESSGTEYMLKDYDFELGDKVLFHLGDYDYDATKLKSGCSSYWTSGEGVYSKYLTNTKSGTHSIYVETDSTKWVDGKAIWITKDNHKTISLRAAGEDAFDVSDLVLLDPTTSTTKYTTNNYLDLGVGDVFYFTINEIDYSYKDYKVKYSSPSVVKNNITGVEFDYFRVETADCFYVDIEVDAEKDAGVYIKGDNDPEILINYMLIRKDATSEEIKVKLVKSEEKDEYTFEENEYYDFKKGNEFAFYIDGSTTKWFKTMENGGSFFSNLETGEKDIVCKENCKARVYVKPSEDLIYFERDPQSLCHYMLAINQVSGEQSRIDLILHGDSKTEYVFKDNKAYNFKKDLEYCFHIEEGMNILWIRTIENTDLGTYFSNDGQYGNIKALVDSSFKVYVKSDEQKVWFEPAALAIKQGEPDTQIEMSRKESGSSEFMILNNDCEIGDKYQFSIANYIYAGDKLKAGVDGWEADGNYIRCTKAGKYDFYVETDSSKWVSGKAIWVGKSVENITYTIKDFPNYHTADNAAIWAWVFSNESDGHFVSAVLSQSEPTLEYTIIVKETFTKAVICRVDKNAKSPTWADVYNKTDDMTLDKNNPTVNCTGWVQVN